jgi:glycosyltransferase involved in cell wall biosynthesis
MSVEARPDVSVLIPTFNRGHFLKQAVASALGQSLANIEVIVSDNGSTDGTAEIVHQMSRADGRLRYHRNERNLGLAGNFRKCFELARSKYCVVLDDDNFFLDPDYLRDGVALLGRFQAGLLLTDCLTGDGRDIPEAPVPRGAPAERAERIAGSRFFERFLERDFNILIDSALFDRALAATCQAFADPRVLCPDLELWAKMMLLTDVVYYHHPVVYYRKHAGCAVFNFNLERHQDNLRYLDNVYDFAVPRVGGKAAGAWRKRMYKMYLLSQVANECIRRAVKPGRFARWAADLGKVVGITYGESLRTYYWKLFKRRLKERVWERNANGAGVSPEVPVS